MWGGSIAGRDLFRKLPSKRTQVTEHEEDDENDDDDRYRHPDGPAPAVAHPLPSSLACSL